MRKYQQLKTAHKPKRENVQLEIPGGMLVVNELELELNNYEEISNQWRLGVR
jgi:hypothetical protein